MWYGDKKVYMGRTSTGRQAQLFQLLMISPGFQISKEKLMADIYKSGEFNNRNNSVNNAIYRLRKMLTDAGVPGDEYIAIENGNCVWKEDIPVQVDTVEFKRLLEESRDAEDDDKLHILQEAWLLYRGPLLASNSIEEWAIPENLHYKELYRDCTNQIADILKEKELKVLNTLSVPIIIIIYLGFIYLTYNPPHKFIFYDILNEKYGINEYKKITKYR